MEAQDCGCDTIDGNETNFLCRSSDDVLLSDYVLGANILTSDGSQLFHALYSHNGQVTFDGLDINPNADVIYVNGQTDYDVFEPVKKFFTTSGAIGETYFALRVGKNDTTIRANFAKILADPELTNKAADNFAKLIKKFAGISGVKMPIFGKYKNCLRCFFVRSNFCPLIPLLFIILKLF